CLLPAALPVRAVDAHLDRLDATVLRPRHAAEGDRTLADDFAAAWYVDTGLGLDRPSRRPAPPRPVRLGLVEARHFEVDDPFGGRHVPVQPRHDEPRG